MALTDVVVGGARPGPKFMRLHQLRPTPDEYHTNADAIEGQLAQVDADGMRRADARGDVWEERVRMMAWWADRCEEMRGA